MAITRQTGVTSDTLHNLQLDAGIIKIAGTSIGATVGGGTFVVNEEIREPEIDGVPGPLMGTRRIVGIRAELEVTGKEWKQTLIDFAIKGTNGVPDNYLIDSSIHKEVAYIGQLSQDGSTVVITLKNAICEAPEFAMADKNEGTIKYKFVAHFDPNNITAIPYSVVRVDVP